MSETNYIYEEEEIGRVELDFDALKEWRDTTQDDIPICSCLSLYKACGLQDIIKKYSEANEDAQIVAIDNLLCNFYTLQEIKNFITNNWEVYSLDIKEDKKVYWDTSRWAKNVEHYNRKLRAKVRNSINMDFVNYCPGLDDDLEDNVIKFCMYHKVEVPVEVEESDND